MQKRSALQEPRLAPKEASVCRAGPDSDEEEAKLLWPLLYLIDSESGLGTRSLSCAVVLNTYRRNQITLKYNKGRNL